ncbi:ATP synthase subunit a [Emticicia oligotrophica DSM 17448]|uniref:ATP synthase subunit a n=1 Tax=Emticicia oligotrophica (strain DSM 17448 / CIP 109782 / MTCC 6937 / GPTSA100-15) TaxID=929562 RepID=A0ABM5N7G0_EMTOG|nr:F0F1 ATP synthase subunit A [Emticicia oligotrophica]AFK05435.1 ATP synthase subunit a [Emticicia oligotrophica DSM 17448]
MLRKITGKLLLVLSLSVFSFSFSFAQEGHEATHENHESKEATHEEEKFDIGKMIMHHIADSHEWEFAHGLTIPLPVILYTKQYGLEVFSSKRFTEGNGVYNGYINLHEHIHRLNPQGGLDEEVHVIDLSITKNVASMILSAIILVTLMSTVAKGFSQNRGKAPKGIQSFLEPIIIFIRDEVVKPNIGPKYEKYLPYLLTLFFFILINNLLGLLPGGANLTGNIAITLFLAVITFILTHVNANKHYWMHLVKPEGVPAAMLPLMWVVEIAGVFMKPMSLTIRLFANITAGHIIILSLLGLIFIFQSAAVGGVVTLFTLFMNLIELMVAFLQAFIFTLLSSMYIGSAIEEHHEADHGH